MQRVIPNIWSQGTAAEAGAFYASVFPDTSWAVIARYPEVGLPDFQRDFAGKELVVDVTIRGYRIRLINAGNEFRPNPSFSFIISMSAREMGGDDAAARAEIDRMWHALSEDGEVRMPLQGYPHSPHYGWVEDKYGVNWQLMLAVPTGDDDAGAPVLPNLMFTGSEPRAQDAIAMYTEVFPDAEPGAMMPYPPGAAPWAGGIPALMFADFTVAGSRLSAMDGGPDHDFTFTPGVSLEVDCADQAEIDRLWEALSAVPEAEQCGWLVDRFGVSWQIVPAMMDELMQRPGAYQKMLGMKKLVIADF
jgi:predicted 3-demethylubiquinone-9 3-methyltransferase (glyoxalase superfamily)